MFRAGAGSARAYLRREFEGCGSSRADPSRSTDAGDLVASPLNFLGLAMFSQNDSREDTSKVVPVAWSVAWKLILKPRRRSTRPRPLNVKSGLGRRRRGPSGPFTGSLPITMANWQQTSDESSQGGASPSGFGSLAADPLVILSVD
jgi:hypothetical protein